MRTLTPQTNIVKVQIDSPRCQYYSPRRQGALHEKSFFGRVDAATPPDVRRGYAAPSKFFIESGLGPRSGLWPKNAGRSPNRGHSPNIIRELTARHSRASHPAAKPQPTALELVFVRSVAREFPDRSARSLRILSRRPDGSHLASNEKYILASHLQIAISCASFKGNILRAQKVIV